MSQFKQKAALEAFRTFLGGRGLNEATLTVRDGFEAMLDFYETVRARDCVLGTMATCCCFNGEPTWGFVQTDSWTSFPT